MYSIYYLVYSIGSNVCTVYYLTHVESVLSTVYSILTGVHVGSVDGTIVTVVSLRMLLVDPPSDMVPHPGFIQKKILDDDKITKY